MAGRILFLAGAHRHPAAATRHIEFFSREGRIVETVTFLNGKTVVKSEIGGCVEADFRAKLRAHRYPLGELRRHDVDGHPVLFVEDKRPVRLTTDEAMAA